MRDKVRDKDAVNRLKKFQKSEGLKFKNIAILVQSLTHRSYKNESNKGVKHNETLEYLGDSVLALVINEYLYKNYSSDTEGDFALLRSVVVSGKSLSRIAKKLDIGHYIFMGKGEEISGGRNRQSILANCLEAIIGAYYLDSGLKAVSRFILKHFKIEVDSLHEIKNIKDAKSKLQELTQRKYKIKPKYFFINSSGPDHKRNFKMGVKIKDEVYGVGNGPTKQDAEKRAAYKALKKLLNKK